MKITIKESRDWRKLWRLVKQPEIYDRIMDDGAASLARWHKAFFRARLALARNHFFRVFYGGKYAGGYCLFWQADGVFEVHTLLLKEFHGRAAIAIGRFCITKMLSMPWVRKLTSFCPGNLPEVFLFAKLCGFKVAGEMPFRWVKHGISYAVKAVEIERIESCQS